MTGSIPHGVYLKLEQMKGLYLKKICGGYRNIFHFKDGLREYHLIDNGFITHSTMRFLSNGYNFCFEFGSMYVPIKITITDKEYTFENKSNDKLTLGVEAGKLFHEILKEYYSNSASYLHVNDRRKEILIANKEYKKKIIDEKLEEIKKIENDIKKLDDQCFELEKEISGSDDGI